MCGLRVTGSFLLLFFYFLNAQSQGTLYSETNVLSPLAYNHVGSEFWAAGGAGVAERCITAVSFDNPAGLSLNSFRITAEGIWKPGTNWLSGIHYDNLIALPSYVSAGMPLGDLAVELGYCSTYNEKYEIDNIAVTTEAQPNGTGEYISFTETTRIHTGFGNIRWQATEKLSLGITIGVDFVKQEETFAHLSAKGCATRLKIIGGMQYHFSDKFGLGLVVNFPCSTSFSLDYSNSGLWVQADSTTGNNRGLTYYKIESITSLAKSPLFVEAGASLHILQQVEILASVEYQNWSKAYQGKNDLWQFHIGAVATLLPQLSVRLGYFTDRYPDMSTREYYDQSFLTAGVTFQLSEKLSLIFASLTSKPFTEQHPYIMYFIPDESFHQTAFSTGISISF